MRTSSLKTRLLRIVGSASLAGISVPLACGGQSVEAPQEGDAGDTGRGGTGATSGRAGAAGGSGALGGRTGGETGGTAGAPRGGNGSGGLGTSGTGAFGGLGTAGQPGVAGTTPVGGVPGVAGTGGSNAGCFDSGVGTCCSSTECLSLEEAQTLAAQGGAPGAGGEGGSGESACPAGDDLPSGLCYWYGSLTQETPSECCYVYTSGSCCGRPFVVAGEARRASASHRSDWLVTGRAARVALDAETERALAREWLEDARLEHASVASFARFILELLSLGAPAALVELAQSAVADEIQHARRCFALASRYLGEDVGPGPLEIGAFGEGTSIVDVTIETVVAGCVGETLAALQAETQLEVASDPEVRKTLEVIARDEARHAELAWRFVKWAIERDGETVREAARDAFARAERRLTAEHAGPSDQIDVAAFHANGRLTPEERLAAHRRVFREVIAPCRDALLGAANDVRA
jgi:hypothetical protein